LTVSPFWAKARPAFSASVAATDIPNSLRVKRIVVSVWFGVCAKVAPAASRRFREFPVARVTPPAAE
jgi:hypothetical protein